MNFMILTRRTANLATVAVLTAALAVSGCAVAPTAEELSATRDECSQYRTPFTNISNERDQRIARYAQIGAGVGIVGGQAIARKNNEDTFRGAILGGIVGAAVGASGGYLADLQKRSTTTAGLQQAVAGDAARDLRQTDQLVAAMTSLNSCRLNQIAQVERSVRDGGDRAAASARIRLIRQKVEVDNRAINAVVGDLTRTRNLYIGALRQTGADTDSYVASIQRYQPRVTTPQQTARRADSSQPRVTKAKRTAVRVDRSQRPKTSNPVANLGYAERELSAGAAAHAQSIDAALDDLNTLLI